MSKEVRNLLSKLDQDNQPGKVKASADKCLNDFLKHIQWLKSRHVRKNYSDEYLVSICFAHSRIFKQECEVMAYCRAHLAVAEDRFVILLKRIKGDQSCISFKSLIQNKDIIRDYLFDLKNIVEFLEKKRDPSYTFFTGGKAYFTDTIWIFQLSQQLANTSLYQKSTFSHKECQIASVFVLRQALESKFNRIIAVDLLDSQGQTPKLRHAFHYEFIRDNSRFFEFVSVDFSLLRQIYDWCNEIVHKAFQPYAWQADYAHSICSGLFSSGNLTHKGGWSIHGGVRILDLHEMQSAFATHFSGYYDHGLWCVHFNKPEAVTDFYK